LDIKVASNGATYVPEVTSFVIGSTEEAWNLMRIGNNNRAVGATDCNERSSRSHSLLCLSVVGEDLHTKLRSTAKLTLVDLAG
jgi:kinesin family protein C2/C3